MGRKSNAPQRREQIVWALYDCLVEKGHEKVSVKEIAARADLPSGVIHYYFSSKDDIVSNLAEAIVDKYSSMLDERLIEAITADQRIEFAIDFTVDFLIFNRQLNRVFYNLIQMTFERKALGKVVKKMFKDYRERLAGVFKEAGAGRESKMLGAALVALAEGFSAQLLVDPRAFRKVDVRQLITQAVRGRLAAAQGFRKSA
ncbi:MAG: TetR/AcrR family transcriptional regulator [Desulfobacterales bacterium]|jgi:AcrR family transcriptional regulator|nr:TetR/AcrR family transcriptional regulator [Desulfobacterales bacterium]MDH3878382.1 TetR/AcrR family transcriptional regulator [Desulfobacterales bacterium]MDH4009382.1 TetR/AcrR family transcriptional regulator [Desulfobacterales bacterium]